MMIPVGERSCDKNLEEGISCFYPLYVVWNDNER